MKKKLVLTITILLLICIVAASFSGCFLFKEPRHKTLKLSQVYQLTSGDIVFDIANKDAIGERDKIEFSFNNGRTWQEASFNNYNKYYYHDVKESDYGKKYKIAVRIAKDDDNRVSKKSKAISYVVKSPNKFKSDDITGQLIDDLFGLEKEYKDTYRFVFENDKIQIKRYYQEQDEDLNLKAVEENDRINFEYKLLGKTQPTQEDIDNIFSIADNIKVESGNEIFDLAEVWATFFNYLAECDKTYDNEGWKNYDYSKGILEDEYSASVIADIAEEDEKIVVAGKQIIMMVRVKESGSALRSDTFLIKVALK
ncbi:MAG: hypothetical protein K2M75_00400 [Clostridia bacterium]|nr:hypothetical protein [Clostridia bacterium]